MLFHKQTKNKFALIKRLLSQKYIMFKNGIFSNSAFCRIVGENSSFYLTLSDDTKIRRMGKTDLRANINRLWLKSPGTSNKKKIIWLSYLNNVSKSYSNNVWQPCNYIHNLIVTRPSLRLPHKHKQIFFILDWYKNLRNIERSHYLIWQICLHIIWNKSIEKIDFLWNLISNLTSSFQTEIQLIKMLL